MSRILIFFILITALFFVVRLFFPSGKSGAMFSPAWFQFYFKGREARFLWNEINLLYRLATHTRIAHPASLFWSRPQLDACIKALVADLKFKKSFEREENQVFLNQIFELRKRLELETNYNKLGIKNSRDIEALQILQVVVSGAGIFKSKIIQNTHNYLKIERPNSSALPVDFEWQGKNIVAYFSRMEDANYSFESSILEEDIKSSPQTLSLIHSDKVQRTQCRKSLRAQTHRLAYLYPAGIDAELPHAEVISRVKCFLEDFSDTGLSVAIGGTAPVGFRVIVQFVLDNTPVSVSGMVRATQYNEKENMSILRIEAEMLPLKTRNLILCVVLGALREDDNIIPLVQNEETKDGDKNTQNEAEAAAPSGAALSPDDMALIKKPVAPEAVQPDDKDAVFAWDS